MLNIDQLSEYLNYDPDTGLITRKKATCNRVSVGDVVGSKSKNGYMVCTVEYKKYYNHRLAWFFVYGEWPEGDIDHVNGIKDDNRISNLRSATRSQNNMNTKKRVTNTSGVKGVSWCKMMNKWFACLGIDGKVVKVGYFSNLDDAQKAITKARNHIHGNFANQG